MAYSYDPYEESEKVRQAQEAMDEHQNAKPGEYQSQYSDQLGGMLDQIMNRGPFSYDLNGDALWQQYKDQYINGGQMAMMDTMAQASGMTGGYGNSYAAMAGQQVYQQWMKGMTDKIPELYGAAYKRYQDEGDSMVRNYGLLSDREQQDYSRYRDSYDQWEQWQQYLASRYDTERNYDLDKYYNDRDYDWNVHEEDMAQAKKEAEWYIRRGKMPPDDVIERSGYGYDYVKKRAKEWKEKLAAQAAGGGGGGGSGYSDDFGLLAAKALQSGYSIGAVMDALKGGGASDQAAQQAIVEAQKMLADGARTARQGKGR